MSNKGQVFHETQFQAESIGGLRLTSKETNEYLGSISSFDLTPIKLNIKIICEDQPNNELTSTLTREDINGIFYPFNEDGSDITVARRPGSINGKKKTLGFLRLIGKSKERFDLNFYDKEGKIIRTIIPNIPNSPKISMKIDIDGINLPVQTILDQTSNKYKKKIKKVIA